MRVRNFSWEAKLKMLNFLEVTKQHFYQNDCLMGISEIFDGLSRETAN